MNFFFVLRVKLMKLVTESPFAIVNPNQLPCLEPVLFQHAAPNHMYLAHPRARL